MNLASATGPSRRHNRRRRFLADENGATAVEFALVAAPFVALLVAIIQTFIVIFAAQLLETVVTQSSRLILTGQAQSANMTQSQFAAQVCAQVVILFNCSNLMIDVQASSAYNWQFNPGTAGQVVVVRVMYQWPVFGGPLGFTLSNLSNGNRLIMASAAFQNEPGS
jgi:Flp pilus assembly protein TadG